MHADSRKKKEKKADLHNEGTPPNAIVHIYLKCEGNRFYV
jgi:hypothetical protein